MKLFAIFKNEEFLGTVKNFSGGGLRDWASQFYKIPIVEIKVYELVEVK